MGLKVIGAGFGRTGTLSLKQALEHLGFHKCYHMAEVTPEHVPLWRAAWRGSPDWSRLFDGYQAAVDWPVAAFWPALLEAFPEAKIILTVREPEGWYRSAAATIFQRMQDRARQADPSQSERVAMAREIIAEGTFGGDLNDKDNAIEVFKANIERVKAEVPSERLIVFEAEQGWAGLCGPLGLPVPEIPYPSVNSTEEFRQRWQSGVSPVVR